MESKKVLRLTGGAGGRRVADLNPEERKAREVYELLKKQRQRAKAKGLTLEQYRAGIASRPTKEAESSVRADKEAGVRAERRREMQKQFAKDRSEASGAGGSLADIDVGGEASENARRVRLAVEKQLKKLPADDWNRVSKGVGKAAMKNLEIRKDYTLFEGSLNKWTIDGGKHRDPALFLDLCRPLAERAVVDAGYPPKKVWIALTVRLSKYSLPDGSSLSDIHAFRSDIVNLVSDKGIREGDWPKMTSQILTKISKHQGVGSGWVLVRIESLFVHVDKYNPLDDTTGRPTPAPRSRMKPPPRDYDDELSGSSHIPLPKLIAKSGSVVNIRNDGDDCFPLSVGAAQMIEDNPKIRDLERIPKTLRKKASELNMGDIQLPMKIRDIPKFEELNPTLRVSVYGLNSDESKVVPLYCKRRFGDEEKSKPILLLFFWGDGRGNYHYSPIKNFASLIAMQRLTVNSRRTQTCHNCMHVFSSRKYLEKHDAEGECYLNDRQRTLHVSETVKFKEWRRTQVIPFAVYSDSESFSIPLEQGELKNTMRILRQTPSGLGYCIVGPPGYTAKYKRFTTIEEYLKGLVADVREIYHEYFTERMSPNLTESEKESHKAADSCYQCGMHPIVGDNKHLDHDHFTGRYRGAACRDCNLLMRKPKFFPVYFHNIEGYDGPLIVQEVARILGIPDCLSRGSQKYITFSVKVDVYPDDDSKFHKVEIKFMDSLKLMSSGLSNLVATLGDDDMKVTKSIFPDMTETQSKLMRRKGVYPYDWVDGPDKLTRIGLPPIRDFYNRLTGKECSIGDYMHAHRVWCEFGCATMQDYHDLYLKSDVCQLADVVEKFRITCRETYGLDPPWYPTAPGLSWDAMLKITGVELKTIPDPDMHLFIDRAIRGGISVVTKRHSEANHKYMVDFDPSKPSVFIQYLDMNNLYGGAMTKSLPNGDLRWMTDEELSSLEDIVGHGTEEDTGTGGLVEVGLKYPDEIHDLHSDYPMACERMVMGESDVEKLVPNLNDKDKYIMHHSTLRQCLRHGLKLTRVYRGLIFSQSKWMKKYIELNTHMRSMSTTKFEQDFYKLMNNAAFGKTMEDVRGRTDIKLVSDVREFRRMVSKSEYIGSTVFSDGRLAEVELTKKKVKLDKTRYVGAAILELSKFDMYMFFYEHVKPKWGERVRLLFTDTDSFCMEIHTEDYYADIAPDIETHFDTSKIRPDNLAVTENLLFKTGVNGRVLGMMKDEAEGANIVEFVGLRSKSNATRMEGDDTEDTKRCKGVKKSVVDDITFKEYKDCLFTRAPVYKTQNTIRNRLHDIYVESTRKKALCGEDDKRFIMENRVDTLPWGHYSLR